MSLEHAVQENTAAIRDLIAVLRATNTAGVPEQKQQKQQKQPEQKQPEQPEQKQPEQKQPAEKKSPAERAVPASTLPTAKAAADDAQAKKAEDSAQPTLQDTADAVLKVARVVSHAAALAILKAFGAEKLTQVSPENFAAVIARCNEVLP